MRLFPEIDLTQLPNLLTGESPDPVGTVLARAAKALGVASAFAGAPVYHGVGDLASAATGAMRTHRADRDGSATRAYVYLVRAGGSRRARRGRRRSRTRRGTGRFDCRTEPGSSDRAASMVTAGGREWARRALLPGGRNSLRDLDAAAANAPAGCDGTLFLPHLNGERSPFVDASRGARFERLRANRRRRHVSRGSPKSRTTTARSPSRWTSPLARTSTRFRSWGWREIGAVDPDVGGRVTNAGGARRGRRHRRRARVRGGRLRQPRRVGRRGSAGGVFPRWSRGRRRTHGTA